MRHSFTAVLSRNERFTSDFETEPYEVGWAGEARLFVHVLELTGQNPRWNLYVQVSPDGLFWCDLETPELILEEDGLYTRKLREFGNWIRLRGQTERDGTTLRPIIYLALKE